MDSKRLFGDDEIDLGLRSLFGLGPRQERLESLHLIQSVDVDEFLRVLNERPYSPADHLRGLGSVQVQRAPIYPQPVKCTNSRRSPSIRTPEVLERLRFAAMTDADLLRSFVDEWLDSGYSHGHDDPRERRINNNSPLSLAAWEFSRNGGVRFLPGEDGLSIFLRQDSGPKAPAFAWVNREEFVRQQIVFMLLSDLRFKLAKCRSESCGQYFLLKQWKRAYKNGTRCSECYHSQRTAYAIAITKGVRDDAAKRLRGVAARRFRTRILKNPSWHRDVALKDSIAQFLNREIAKSGVLKSIYKSGVTGKWVARNWAKIQEALEALSK